MIWLLISAAVSMIHWTTGFSLESYEQPGQNIKKERHYFANKGPSSQGYGFSSGHVWMWELDYEESWALMNWCFWTVVLEKTLESPLDCKEIQPVHSEGDQSWVFIGRTDFEAETPILWPPDVKSWLIGKIPWCLERLRAEGEDDNRGWDGWMASLTPWTWVWVDSRSWWWTARPGVLRFLVSQRVGHDWATELNWTSKISKAFMIDQIKFCRPLVRLYVEFLFIRISSRIQFVMRVSWYIASLPVSGAS